MTADLLNPTTQIEAVNWSLEACGYAQVTSLTGVLGRDATTALLWLTNATRDLCRKGFWYCRRNLVLTPDPTTGFLVLPTNVLSISMPEVDCWSSPSLFSPLVVSDWLAARPVMRQGKVFSVTAQSYVWTAPLTVMIREALAFEDMPDEARQYAMVLSASGVNGSTLRSDAIDKKLQPLLTLAWDALVTAELENSNHRFL